MKKIIISLIAVLAIFSITACKGKDTNNTNDKKTKTQESKKQERESIKNQQGYQEGQYKIDDLTFNLPDGYELNGDNRYTYTDTSNALIVELYVDDNVDDIYTFIGKDKHSFYPTVEDLKETNINGNTWLKGETIDNAVVYYIKDGSKVYSVMLSPVFTLASMFEDLVNTFESSLYFKVN